MISLDCDLVALLEDDTGMELLVCNKIISLELPVKDVHRKIWCAEHNEVVFFCFGILNNYRFLLQISTPSSYFVIFSKLWHNYNNSNALRILKLES